MVGGKQYDLEMHIVHKYKDSDPAEFGAVLGVFFDVESGGNEENPFIASLNFDGAVPKSDAVKGTPIENVDLASFLSSIDMTNYWSYPGSLTTPPCSEGIKWSVL